MIARVWAAIGRAPMYRVVLCALAVLAGASFVASAVGWLYYSPAELALRPMGTNPATVTSVPVSIGKAVEV